ncbi:MAG: GntR family transcriptional regulator [Lachnospiraceae bacterium]|nr:GntR family transcriptional regulator [Lachnospiraceae bacterium]
MKLTTKSLSAQVRDEIKKMVNTAEFMTKLPSEQELAASLGVSRNTVREALKTLEQDGLVLSRHGVGTFATRYNGTENIRYNISTLDSTTKIIAEHGYSPGTVDIYYDVRPATDDIAQRLGCESPLNTLYIERVRTADDLPIAFVEDYVPYVDGMIESFGQSSNHSLFAFIQTYSSISFSNCSIHAALSDERLMQKLNLSAPKALLLLKQIHYSPKGTPVFYSNSYFITEKLEFNIIRRCTE